ncbi:2080_t:CDS:1 [Paraglomus brasilianum]|uniref:2080_t:CDS:1 n=1 Tax=Paraglomus brasilianum TaxID=144538 RepID=A0A9N8Z6W2_9GLOM|nr:2080_t:CDS:1 [Paraglomus brasilianum]
MNTAQKYPTLLSLFPLNLRQKRQKKDKKLLKRYGGSGSERRRKGDAQYIPLRSHRQYRRGTAKADKSPHTCKNDGGMERGKAEKIPFLPAPLEDGKQMLPFDSSSRDNRWEAILPRVDKQGLLVLLGAGPPSFSAFLA